LLILFYRIPVAVTLTKIKQLESIRSYRVSRGFAVIISTRMTGFEKTGAVV